MISYITANRRLGVRPRSAIAAWFVGGLIMIATTTGVLAQGTPPSTRPAVAAPATTASKPVEPPAIPPGAPSSETGSQYVIGPGDAIQIFVWRNPELTVSVPVRPDGKVSSPLVEDMVAAGKTPTQLARDVEIRLAEYIRTPQVSIIVTGAVSTFSQIRVIGQVRNPQALPFREGMTILDVALAVGGLTDFAAGNRAKIMRKGPDGKDQTIKARIEDVLKKGKLSENVKLMPGDVIIVPESIF
jgi:polysaccharide export outer membrane protein